MRKGWEIKKLGDICDIKNGRSQKSVENPTGQYPIYGSGGVMGYADDYICEAGTTIVGRKGTINKPLFVNCAFWNVDTAFGLQPKPKTNPRFLFYTCKSIDFNRYNKSTTLPSLVKSDLLKIDIPVPPIAEQEKIVAELDCLSGIIEKKKEQLKELDNLAQSIFYDMFGDPITNEKGWEVKKLGEIGTILTGSTPTTRDAENYSSNDYCFVKPGDIRKDAVERIDKTECYISTKAFLSSRKLPPGSILTTCIGIVGKVGIVEIEATCNQQINALLPNEGMSSIYVATAILLNRKKLEAMANAPVVPIINKKDFSSISIPFPPTDLQIAYAQKIETIERHKKLIRKSIAEMEILFNSRMDYWFN